MIPTFYQRVYYPFIKALIDVAKLANVNLSKAVWIRFLGYMYVNYVPLASFEKKKILEKNIVIVIVIVFLLNCYCYC